MVQVDVHRQLLVAAERLRVDLRELVQVSVQLIEVSLADELVVDPFATNRQAENLVKRGVIDVPAFESICAGARRYGELEPAHAARQGSAGHRLPPPSRLPLTDSSAIATGDAASLSVRSVLPPA